MKKLIFVAVFLIAGCHKKDPPPPIEVCVLGPFGGAQCVDAHGMRSIKYPTQLANYWAASQEDMKKLLQWCYSPGSAAEAQLINAGIDAYAENLHGQASN